MALPEISEQEMLFVEEYCKDRNAVRSALKAGYSKSYFAAAGQGRELLKKPQIKFWIKRLLSRHAKALKFKPTRIVKNWMMAALADPSYFVVNEEGKIDTAPGVSKQYLRVVRKVKQTKYGHEIELRDPHGPEVKLMEHFKELIPDEAGDEPDELLTELLAELKIRRAKRAGGRASNPESDKAAPMDPE